LNNKTEPIIAGIKILMKNKNKDALKAEAAATPISPRKKTETPSLIPSSLNEIAGKKVFVNITSVADQK
jgi:hypothetical protein